jgi:transcriptional regulator with XRE-family HTH domain
MTLEALAARAGVSYQYLSGVETGQKNFTIQVLETLSNALDLSVEQLVALAYGPAGTTAPPLVNTTAPTLDTAVFAPSRSIARRLNSQQPHRGGESYAVDHP